MPFDSQPLGTIIASILNFNQLCASIGEAGVPDMQKTYAPCDGTDVRYSALTHNTGIVQTPDLRGQFLRGLNAMGARPLPANWVDTMDPDGNGRFAGSNQLDAFRSHTHGYTRFTNNIIRDMSNDKDQRLCSFGDSVGDTTGPPLSNWTSDLETRPRNVAVYYYIRIN